MAQDNINNNHTDNLYDSPKQNPDYGSKFTNKSYARYKEQVYERINHLLLKRMSQIEEVFGDFSELQKTFRGGKLQKGKSNNEMAVVYEKDIDASKDQHEEDLLFSWLDLADISQLQLFIDNETQAPDGSIEQPKSLRLELPDKPSFIINDLLGTMDFGEVKLKDGVSQYLKLKKGKTNINRQKLKQYVDTEFSELTPITYTHKIEQYQKLKKALMIKHRLGELSFYIEHYRKQKEDKNPCQKIINLHLYLNLDLMIFLLNITSQLIYLYIIEYRNFLKNLKELNKIYQKDI